MLHAFFAKGEFFRSSAAMPHFFPPTTAKPLTIDSPAFPSPFSTTLPAAQNPSIHPQASPKARIHFESLPHPAADPSCLVLSTRAAPTLALQRAPALHMPPPYAARTRCDLRPKTRALAACPSVAPSSALSAPAPQQFPPPASRTPAPRQTPPPASAAPRYQVLANRSSSNKLAVPASPATPQSTAPSPSPHQSHRATGPGRTPSGRDNSISPLGSATCAA